MITTTPRKTNRAVWTPLLAAGGDGVDHVGGRDVAAGDDDEDLRDGAGVDASHDAGGAEGRRV